MFWQFDTGIVSQIETILDSETVTLKQLLNEDDVIQECKAQNQKLLQFLTKPEITDELVSLIITEPPEDEEEKLRFKYPNIACELLTSDSPPINDALAQNTVVLNKLCGFLETDKILNPLIASFFSKTMAILCVKRTELMFEFLKTRDDFVDMLLKHIETSAVIDLLFKLITGIDNIDMRNLVVKWLSEKGLVSKLVAFFKDGFSCEQQVNASQFLCDMVKATREHQSLLQDKAEIDPLLDELETSSTISELLENMFNSKTECVLVNGISVLQSLLEYKKHSANIQQQPPSQTQQNIQASNSSDFDGIPQCLAPSPMFCKQDGPPEAASALDAERLTKGVLQVQSAIIPRLGDFHSILLEPPEKAPIKTTVGLIAKPLGASRLEIVHLIRALLSSNNPDINQKLYELKTLTVIIDLFFTYPWNNFLHTLVEQGLKSIFNNIKSSSPVTSPNTTAPSTSAVAGRETALLLVADVLEDGKLVQRMLDAWSAAEGNAAEKQPRPGYMGHIVKIANLVADASQEEVVKTSLDNLPENIGENWKEFVAGTLADINKRIQTPLVNEIPSNHFEEDVVRQENALQQAFIEYQMQQMTRNLCSQIGFNTAEFTELDDMLPIQPEVDQLTKINFSLDAPSGEESKSFIYNDVVSDRVKSNDSNSSDDDDFWEDKDSTEKNIFTDVQMFKSQNVVNKTEAPETKMEVESDPWPNFSSEPSSTAAVAMDSDPWSDAKPSKSSDGAAAVEWADFASFETNFGASNSTVPTTPPPNTCVAQTVCTSSLPTSTAAEEPETPSVEMESPTEQQQPSDTSLEESSENPETTAMHSNPVNVEVKADKTAVEAPQKMTITEISQDSGSS